MKENGKLFVFEGPNSVGKTSLSKLLAEHCRKLGNDSLLLSFPGNMPGTIGALIYELHHAPQKFGIKSISSAALQILHVAAHVDAIESQILPALAAGRNVILDRFWWSTMIYGQLNGLSHGFLKSIVKPEVAVWGDIKPSAIFLLERTAPYDIDTTPEWLRCQMLYSAMASGAATDSAVHSISNDRGIESALASVLEIVDQL